MKNTIICCLILFGLALEAKAQDYLSHLHDTQDDPVYTTYAAAMSRSQFTINEGYQFIWYDPEKGLDFLNERAGTIGLIFKMNNSIVYRLDQYYKRPVITASYSDIVKFYYYPFKDVRIEETFLVYTSKIAVRKIKIINESSFDIRLSIYPFVQSSIGDYTDIKVFPGRNGFTFHHKEYPDGWMKDHNIPFVENLKDVVMLSRSFDSWGKFNKYDKENDTSSSIFINRIKNDTLSNAVDGNTAKIIGCQKRFTISGGKSTEFRIVKGTEADTVKNYEEFETQCSEVLIYDLDKFIQTDESSYSKIPQLNFGNKEYQALYWNAFTLLRQCMMPPEGKCHYNYYIFSREPKWGWGYGGQVFHESLSMLAYVYMDPIGAENSQRVFMERQHPDGYINYRTGPYLDETIPTNGQFTSSAPWFNWENWEIYKVSHDKKFLAEAYESGKKFYEFWLKNRDSNHDGLCEWGGNGVLECVRDAYVALWDEVGDPENFDAVDLNMMLVKEAKSLADMAKALGHKKESEFYLKDAEKRTELINKYMWDPKTGFYYQINKNDHSFTYPDKIGMDAHKKKDDLKRKEIIGFLALWSGVASKEQAAILVKHLTDPKEFWRKYGVPSLSADDPYYNPIGYWNGPVWVPWNYLIFRGLIDYGYKKEAKELAEKVLDNVSYQLKTNHWFWELYSADNHEAGWHKAYIWTGIIARMMIDEEMK